MNSSGVNRRKTQDVPGFEATTNQKRSSNFSAASHSVRVAAPKYSSSWTVYLISKNGPRRYDSQ